MLHHFFLECAKVFDSILICYFYIVLSSLFRYFFVFKRILSIIFSPNDQNCDYAFAFAFNNEGKNMNPNQGEEQ